MGPSRLVPIAAALLGTVLPLGLAGQQPPTFRSDTKMVSLLATVTGPDGRLVPDLTRDDFEVFDNEKRQPIVVFSNEVQPITVGVMLDTSASMTSHLATLKAGAEQFFLRMLPADRCSLGAFNDKIQRVAALTSDRDALVAALADVDFGNPTRLHDAIAAALDDLRGIEGRRVVLVFTDGENTSGKTSFDTVLDRARLEEVMVYAIGLRADYFDGVKRVQSRPARSLKRLAEETGGGFFELEKTDQLASTFTRVAQELHSQYLIGFRAETRDGRTHRLSIRVKQPGMTARARKSYVASWRSSAPLDLLSVHVAAASPRPERCIA